MQSDFSEKQIQNHFARSLCCSNSRSNMRKAVKIAKIENPHIVAIEDFRGDEIQMFVFDWMQENLWRRPSMKEEILNSLWKGEAEMKISVAIFLNAIRDFVRRNRFKVGEFQINHGIKTLQQIANAIAFSNFRTTVADFPNTPFFNVNRMDKVQKPSAVERQMRRWEKSGKVKQPDLKVDGSAECYFNELKRTGAFKSSGCSAFMTLVPYQLLKEMDISWRVEYERKYSVRLVPEFLCLEEEMEFGIETGCLYRDRNGLLNYVPDEDFGC